MATLSLSQRLQIADAVLSGIAAVKARIAARPASCPVCASFGRTCCKLHRLRLVDDDMVRTAELPALTMSDLVSGGR